MIKRKDEIIPADGSIYAADIPDDITAKELIELLKEIPGNTIIQNPAQNVLRAVLVDNHGTPLTPISDVPEIEECEVNDTIDHTNRPQHYLGSDEYFGVMSGLDELDNNFINTMSNAITQLVTMAVSYNNMRTEMIEDNRIEMARRIDK